MRENYNEGQLIKFKTNLWNHYDIPNEREFFKLIEENFISSDYEWENFIIRHEHFKSFLKERNILTIFIDTGYLKIRDKIDSDFYYYDAIWTHIPKYTLSSEDTLHLSEFGHTELGNELTKFIKQHIMI